MALNQNFIDEVKKFLTAEQFYINEPMSKHTTFNIGGPADYLIFPGSMEEVSKIFTLLRDYDIPHNILGNGSNVLVLDKGTIVESGNYDELIEKKGMFADLVARQRLEEEE